MTQAEILSTETVQTDGTTPNNANEDIATIRETLPRVLDGFRELLNLEHEAMVMLRELRREHDNDKIDAAEKDFTEILYDLKKYTHSPEFLKDYFSRLGVEQLKMAGNTFDALLRLVVKATQVHVKAMTESLKLALEDSKKGN